MGVYSVSEYGSGSYGEILPSRFATPISIRPVGYDGLFLSWEPPGGNWSDLAIVRSSYGYPTAPSDGVVVVLEPKADVPLSLSDTGLAPGRFYYYTLFVYATDDARWVRGARAMGLVVEDHAYGETMWELLPGIYRTRDEDYRGSFDDGPLRRFMGLLGYQFDRVRTEADTLLHVGNIDRISGDLLPVLAGGLGVGYEPELGMRTSRTLVKNAVYLAKIKGTLPGVEGITSTYTDFGATAVVGKNLMLDMNDSGWVEDSIGHWVAAGATLDNYLPGEYAAAVAGTGTLRIIASGGGDAIVESGTHAGATLIPVAPSTAYTASVYVRAASTTRTTNIALVYYDAVGTIVGTTSGTAAANTTGWVRRTASATSPASARWAVIRATVTGPVAAEEHLVSAAQLEKAGASTAWESGRKVHVYLEPRRTNLVPNPSFETNTTGWTGTATTLARVTTQFVSGAASLSLTKITAVGTATATTPTGTSGIAVLPSEPYTFSTSLKPNTTARNVTLAIGWYTAAGALISTATSAASDETAAAWKRFSHTAMAPATAAFAALVVNVASAAINEVHWVDAVLFENTEFLKDYFDASLFPPSDYLWAGAAHTSASMLYPRRAAKDERLNAVLPDYVPAGVQFQTHYGETAPASSI